MVPVNIVIFFSSERPSPLVLHPSASYLPNFKTSALHLVALRPSSLSFLSSLFVPRAMNSSYIDVFDPKKRNIDGVSALLNNNLDIIIIG
jgi:hypothetical protein